MKRYSEQPRTRCKVKDAHCENCGRTLDPFRDAREGYTYCCNELVTYPNECRNLHDDEGEAVRS